MSKGLTDSYTKELEDNVIRLSQINQKVEVTMQISKTRSRNKLLSHRVGGANPLQQLEMDLNSSKNSLPEDMQIVENDSFS